LAFITRRELRNLSLEPDGLGYARPPEILNKIPRDQVASVHFSEMSSVFNSAFFPKNTQPPGTA
jgi:hypothetical protein